MMKKNLLKKMSVVVAAVAIMVSALPISASAASYNSGDYTASVNFYVPRKQAPQHLYNAYLNDTSIPPKNESEDNVIVHISDKGVITFTLPINNAQLGIKTLGSADGVTTVLSEEESTNCSQHEGIRYKALTASITTANNGADTLNYTFSKSTFHAKITKNLIGSLSIIPYDGNFEANPVLEIELPSTAIKK